MTGGGTAQRPVARFAGRLGVWLCLVLVLAFAAQLRLQATFQTEVDRPIRADAAAYFWYAFNLRQFGVYSLTPPNPPTPPTPDAVRTPGYPLFLAALMDLPPTQGTVVRIVTVQAVVGIIVVALTFLLAQPIIGRAWAVGAALLVALSPHLVNAGVYVLTETLFSLALLAFLLVLARRDVETRSGWLFLAGALLGIAALIRPTVNYLPVALVALFFVRGPWRQGARASAALVLGFALVLAPWVARNAPLPGGADDRLKINMLHHGMYPDLSYEGVPESYGFPYAADPRATEIGASLASVTAEIRRRFAEEPVRHLRWFLVGKPLTLWSWNEPQGMGGSFVYPVTRSPYFDSSLFQLTHAAMFVLHWPLVILATLFCVRMAVPGWYRALPAHAVLPAQACAVLLLYVTALHMVGFPLPRYTVPFRPELYLAACATLALLADLVRRRVRPLPAAAIAKSQ